MVMKELLPEEIAEIEEESDPSLVATLEFEETAHYLDLEDWIIQRLRCDEREISLNLTLTRDHGEETVVSAMRVQHHCSRGGPTLGPVRWSKDVRLPWVRAAAIQATWQSALLRLPFGGGAGAIQCNPEEFSERELRDATKGYAHGLRGWLGAFSDVLAPGRGCNEQIMAWMLSEHAQDEPGARAAVVGKPPVLWGWPEYYSASAQGVLSVLRNGLGRLLTNKPGSTQEIRGRRIGLQGFGTAGRSIANLLQRAGACLVAAADVSGGLYNSNGLDAAALNAHVASKGVLFGYPAADAVCNADVLEAECEVLILAAAERQITLSNAPRIRAPLIIEMARGAITRAAEQALFARGITVIPHLIASAGSTIAAYVEWVRNTQESFESAPSLSETIDRHLLELLVNVGTTVQQHKLSPRRAALQLAVQRVASQMRLAGKR